MKAFSIKTDAGYQGAAAPLADRLALRVPSNAVIEEYDFLNAFPSMRKLVDEVVIQNLRTSGFALRNEEFEATIGLSQLDILGDRLGLYGNMAAAMGSSARNKPDELMATLLANAFTSGTDYTGTAFFAADKVAYPGATAFTNVTTGKLTADRYAAGISNLCSRLNSRGRPMGLGKKIQLVVAPKNRNLAFSIVQAEKLANGADNPNRNSAEVVIWSQLAAAGMENTWFLFEQGSEMKPFIWQELLPLQYYSITNPQDSHVVKHKTFIYQTYAVMNLGYAFPEMAYGSDGTVD
jgi:phage major head subunit gpT-like protein